jgi:hypothetical protein
MQIATLNPLDKGECYGLSMEQMRDQMPVRFSFFILFFFSLDLYFYKNCFFRKLMMPT